MKHKNAILNNIALEIDNKKAETFVSALQTVSE